MGLLEVQRRGTIHGVWYDDGTKIVSIKRTLGGQITRVSWVDAAALVRHVQEDTRTPRPGDILITVEASSTEKMHADSSLSQ